MLVKMTSTPARPQYKLVESQRAKDWTDHCPICMSWLSNAVRRYRLVHARRWDYKSGLDKILGDRIWQLSQPGLGYGAVSPIFLFCS